MINLRQQIIADGWEIKYIRDPWYLGESGDTEITIIYLDINEAVFGSELEYRYSVCSEKDNFSRDIGVAVAYDKSSNFVSSCISDPIHAILEDIMSKDVKRSLKEGIKQYLIDQRIKELDKIIGG